jgi:hypothetical protein
MNEELVKSLTSLIDETIAEIEDLKKSRFAASEIKLAGPGEDGIKGHSADGKLDKEEDDKKDDKDDKKDEKKDDKKMDKKEDDKDEKKDDKKEDKAEKAEGHNRQSDPDGGNHKPVAGEGDKHGQGPSSSPAGSAHHGNGKNREADPNGGNHKMDKSDGYPVDLKRSVEESNTLMKSYIDSKVAPLETKLAGILDLVKKIADQPVAAKGATTKNFAVLHKSDSEQKSLSKSQIANKLFELKKSGTFVDSADITAAELGSSDLQAIVTKYGLQ